VLTHIKCCFKIPWLSVRSVLLTKYYSGNQVETNEMVGHVACMGESISLYGVLVGKPETAWETHW
jgi:hypothetical protein